MTLPTIHLNGTGKRQLVAALNKASSALDVAFDRLKETAPNGRDYYPQGPAAMAMAEAEHNSRLRRLDAIKEEIDELTMAIDALS